MQIIQYHYQHSQLATDSKHGTYGCRHTGWTSSQPMMSSKQASISENIKCLSEDCVSYSSRDHEGLEFSGQKITLKPAATSRVTIPSWHLGSIGYTIVKVPSVQHEINSASDIIAQTTIVVNVFAVILCFQF